MSLPAPRKIIICLDGTGNEVGDFETNILRLYKGLHHDPEKGQFVHYIPGVGTMDGQHLAGRSLQKLKSLLGLGLGLGLEDDVLDAFRLISRNYISAKSRRDAVQDAMKTQGHSSKQITIALEAQKDSLVDDQIFIFGFSRGAYAARVLAGFIHNFGLVAEHRLHLIPQVFRAYRRVTDFDIGTDPDVTFKSLRQYEKVLRPDTSVPITFLGLFDTVSSMLRFRRPLFTMKKYQSLIEYGHHASVDRNVSVEMVRHALAIDERRSMFRAQHWLGRRYFGNRFRRGPCKPQDTAHRWFPGVHGDIGGSTLPQQARVGCRSLLWMLNDLETSGHRFLFRRNFKKTLSPPVVPDPLVRVEDTHNSMRSVWPLFEFFPKSIKRREWAVGRYGWVYYLPFAEPRRIPPHHDVDKSAFVLRDTSAYDPINLRGRDTEEGIALPPMEDCSDLS